MPPIEERLRLSSLGRVFCHWACCPDHRAVHCVVSWGAIVHRDAEGTVLAEHTRLANVGPTRLHVISVDLKAPCAVHQVTWRITSAGCCRTPACGSSERGAFALSYAQ